MMSDLKIKCPTLIYTGNSYHGAVHKINLVILNHSSILIYHTQSKSQCDNLDLILIFHVKYNLI